MGGGEGTSGEKKKRDGRLRSKNKNKARLEEREMPKGGKFKAGVAVILFLIRRRGKKWEVFTALGDEDEDRKLFDSASGELNDETPKDGNVRC